MSSATVKTLRLSTCGKRLDCAHRCRKPLGHKEPCGDGHCPYIRLYTLDCGHRIFDNCREDKKSKAPHCESVCGQAHQCGDKCKVPCSECERVCELIDCDECAKAKEINAALRQKRVVNPDANPGPSTIPPPDEKKASPSLEKCRLLRRNKKKRRDRSRSISPYEPTGSHGQEPRKRLDKKKKQSIWDDGPPTLVAYDGNPASTFDYLPRLEPHQQLHVVPILSVSPFRSDFENEFGEFNDVSELSFNHLSPASSNYQSPGPTNAGPLVFDNRPPPAGSTQRPSPLYTQSSAGEGWPLDEGPLFFVEEEDEDFSHLDRSPEMMINVDGVWRVNEDYYEVVADYDDDARTVDDLEEYEP